MFLEFQTMKTPNYLAFFLFWTLGLPLAVPAKGNGGYTPNDSSALVFEFWIKNTRQEFETLENSFFRETEPMRNRRSEIRHALQDPRNRTPECGFQMLWEDYLLNNTLTLLTQEHELKLLKLRYRKSIEIVKMLYEKILSMDHHFSSLKAQQGLLNLSNPHFYPAFKENRSLIEERIKKKNGFALPEILKTNPYLSAAFSIVGLVSGATEERDKKNNTPDDIACILDFTVRMHNDLNVIYYETGYLRDANLTLKKECETLFIECSRQVGYTIPLVSCREGDDWERLYNLLDAYVAKALGETAPATNNQSNPGYFPQQPENAVVDERLVQRAFINLQFSVDRVTQFIEKYSNFVGQGSEYYKKFSKIVHNYQNEKACSNALPSQFAELKNDIELTLEKFNSAYRMPEIQGSKLKDMLYGSLPE